VPSPEPHAVAGLAGEPLLDEFADSLWLEDGLARNTLDSYRRDLKQFAQWLRATRKRGLLDAERADLLAYLAFRYQARARPSSAARLLSSLKRFY